MSLCGTNLTIRNVRALVAIGCKADITIDCQTRFMSTRRTKEPAGYVLDPSASRTRTPYYQCSLNRNLSGRRTRLWPGGDPGWVARGRARSGPVLKPAGKCSAPHLAGQAVARWLLFPIWAYVDLVAPTAALGTDDPASEPRHLGLGRIARYVDQCGMSAGIVQTERDQVLHAEIAHVAERHRRAGGVLGVHLTAGIGTLGHRLSTDDGVRGVDIFCSAFALRSVNHRSRSLLRRCLILDATMGPQSVWSKTISSTETRARSSV